MILYLTSCMEDQGLGCSLASCEYESSGIPQDKQLLQICNDINVGDLTLLES